MARYVQTLLADGVAPDGTRVVSATNLRRVWAPGVPLHSGPSGGDTLSDASQRYALGWVYGNYKGQPLVSHGGETWGYVSQVAFLPEADLGLVTLTNGGPGAIPFTYDVQYRLFELLFDPPLGRFFFSVALRQGANGQPEVVLTTPGEVPDALYTGDTPAITYVFTQAESGAAITAR